MSLNVLLKISGLNVYHVEIILQYAWKQYAYSEINSNQFYTINQHYIIHKIESFNKFLIKHINCSPPWIITARVWAETLQLFNQVSLYI